MSNVNVQNLFSLLLLVTLLREVLCYWEYDTDQKNIAPSLFENNFEEALIETLPTTVPTVLTIENTVDDEKFDDNELKKLFLRNFKLFEHLEKDRNQVEGTRHDRRKPRDVENGTISFGMECFSCYANTSTKATTESNCYEGISMPSKKCADAEHCFIELNPQFIKRGCILPGRVNRTFICKCPLCNDKPSFDINHYEYKKVSDWEYDNARLQMPLVGMDLMCKVCETKGTNPTSDKNCRFGKNADYMVCAHNQLCYTNVDDETDFVARGCIDKPLYNSIYFFCNNSECNSQKFYNPKEKLKIRAEELIKLKEEPPRKPKKKIKSFASKQSTYDFYLVLLAILSLTECI